MSSMFDEYLALHENPRRSGRLRACPPPTNNARRRSRAALLTTVAVVAVVAVAIARARPSMRRTRVNRAER